MTTPQMLARDVVSDWIGQLDQPPQITAEHRKYLEEAIASSFPLALRASPEAAEVTEPVAWQVRWKEGGEVVTQFYADKATAEHVKKNVVAYKNNVGDPISIARLYAAPVPADTGLGLSRIGIAMVIDPKAFDDDYETRHKHCSPFKIEIVQQKALLTADRILALLSQRPNPGGEREDTEICLFCGKPSGDDAMVDDNGEVACRSCGEAEFNAQDKEPAAPAQS